MLWAAVVQPDWVVVFVVLVDLLIGAWNLQGKCHYFAEHSNLEERAREGRLLIDLNSTSEAPLRTKHHS